MDSTAGCDLLCFLDAFSSYHHIKMAKEDEEKIAFLTPCGMYCYTCMPFGLKNARATFQRLMRIALGAQMGRNAEAYVDDIVVKSREGDNLLRDLEETFASLRKVNIKLNPHQVRLRGAIRKTPRFPRLPLRHRIKPRQDQGN